MLERPADPKTGFAALASSLPSSSESLVQRDLAGQAIETCLQQALLRAVEVLLCRELVEIAVLAVLIAQRRELQTSLLGHHQCGLEAHLLRIVVGFRQRIGNLAKSALDGLFIVGHLDALGHACGLELRAIPAAGEDGQTDLGRKAPLPAAGLE